MSCHLISEAHAQVQIVQNVFSYKAPRNKLFMSHRKKQILLHLYSWCSLSHWAQAVAVRLHLGAISGSILFQQSSSNLHHYEEQQWPINSTGNLQAENGTVPQHELFKPNQLKAGTFSFPLLCQQYLAFCALHYPKMCFWVFILIPALKKRRVQDELRLAWKVDKGRRRLPSCSMDSTHNYRRVTFWNAAQQWLKVVTMCFSRTHKHTHKYIRSGHQYIR